MNFNKNIVLTALLGTFILSSCDNGFDEMNSNPNNPEIVPTYTIFNSATKRLMDETRDEWVSGRMVLPWLQYSAQSNYVEEDKYQYRVSTGDQAWNNIYRSINNFKTIIALCEDPKTAPQMSQYGDLQAQIGAARIMMAYSFSELANYFGDVPYWSYGGKANTNFQGLDIDTYPQPIYTKQADIFKDVLNELKEAEAQIGSTVTVFTKGDQIYQGNAALWKKFANSLRLKLANQVKDVLPTAQSDIQDAIAKGVFTSNSDNAAQAYGNSSIEGSPFWRAFFTGDNRTDFFINNQFVKLLKGESGTYGKDPRLTKFVAPLGTSKADAASGKYVETDDYSNYQGMPYGLPADRLSANNPFKNLSMYSKDIFSPTYGEILMEYAEVEFILSEVNGWSQANYEKGVQASMDKWGVSATKSAAYIAALPAANKENVITQKYVALFMQPQTAWVEYRRTGYPTGDILLLPGKTGYELDGTPYVFTPLVDGMTDVPSRIAYPLAEQTVNTNNWTEAVKAYGNTDRINGKLWWMP